MHDFEGQIRHIPCHIPCKSRAPRAKPCSRPREVVHHGQNPAAARGKSCTTRKTLRRPELVRFQDAFWAYVQLRGCGVSVGNVFGQLCDFPLRDALGERDANVILSGAMGREVCDVQLLFLASLNQANTHDSGFCYSR